MFSWSAPNGTHGTSSYPWDTTCNIRRLGKGQFCYNVVETVAIARWGIPAAIATIQGTVWADETSVKRQARRAFRCKCTTAHFTQHTFAAWNVSTTTNREVKLFFQLFPIVREHPSSCITCNMYCNITATHHTHTYTHARTHLHTHTLQSQGQVAPQPARQFRDN